MTNNTAMATLEVPFNFALTSMESSGLDGGPSKRESLEPMTPLSLPSLLLNSEETPLLPHTPLKLDMEFTLMP